MGSTMQAGLQTFSGLIKAHTVLPASPQVDWLPGAHMVPSEEWAGQQKVHFESQTPVCLGFGKIIQHTVHSLCWGGGVLICFPPPAGAHPLLEELVMHKPNVPAT